MKYITTKRKFELLVLTILTYNAIILGIVMWVELSDMQQTIDNLAACLDFPEEDRHLCFDWLQALTSTDVTYSWILGGNASIYAIFRIWNAGQHDNQIKRLIGQTYRLSNEIPGSYIPITVDNGWVGGLTYRCGNLYDDYIAAVTKYNDGNLSAKELQLSAQKTFNELSKTYTELNKGYTIE